MSDPRRHALTALTSLFESGRSLSVALDEAALADLSPRDRSLCRALVYGVTRHYRLLDTLIDGYLDRPLRPRDRDLRLILALGFYQLGWMRIPAHAAVSETVGLVEARWARGLVNALLRRYQREGAPSTVDGPAAVRHSHPDWLAAMIAADWKDLAPEILAANNREGPLWLRVDRRRIDRTDYRERLRQVDRDAEPGPSADALRLNQAMDVAALPGFAEGQVFVQDAAAQLAAELLAPQPGERVLDACAAPGGKSAHLLALAPDLDLSCVEADPARAERIAENLERAGDSAKVVVADAAAPQAWWDGQPFDAILLDAPCSGTGVIRRHPDIKWLRREADIAALAAGQAELLGACWSMLRSGGRLLYCTCSVLRDENDRLMGSFLRAVPDARAPSLALPVGCAMDPGWQILPGESDHDGFYYCLAVKR